jgi:hypothetical protein
VLSQPLAPSDCSNVAATNCRVALGRADEGIRPTWSEVSQKTCRRTVGNYRGAGLCGLRVYTSMLRAHRACPPFIE